MAELVYSTIASADGYVADAAGGFEWAAPDSEVHGWINDLERPIGTYLYGRRMYQVMTYWETAHTVPDRPAAERDYARIWRAAEKVVYSSSLNRVGTVRTRLERTFDPDAVRELKRSSERDLSIGGPTLAGVALRAGLVDRCHLFLVPMLVGGGTPAWPSGLTSRLELLDQRTSRGGVVHLHYRVLAAPVRRGGSGHS